MVETGGARRGGEVRWTRTEPVPLPDRLPLAVAMRGGQRQSGHHRGERQQRSSRDHEPANTRRKALEHRKQQVAHSAAATSTAIR